MKKMLLLFGLSQFVNAVLAGNLENIIDKGSVEKLQKFIDKGGDLNECIIMHDEDTVTNYLNHGLWTP